MSEPDPEAEVYPWLPSETVVAWLKVGAGNTAKLDLVEVCRKAAADWIEDQRPDLLVVTEGEGDDEDTTTFEATDRIVMAGLLATARILARSDSPNGVVAFAELGAGSILSTDPDVKRYLGRNKNMPVG